MAVKIHLATELLAANVAGEWFLVLVDNHVITKSLLLRERLVTNLAFVLSVVDMEFGVTKHIGLESKGPIADVTPKRFQTSMDQLMLLQMVLFEELVSTFSADVGPYISVPC